ncbi:MAG: DUF692 family protein [Chloroflexota bacterium]|nr:DUF692 family protein [Chloroflexota bacterium]
MKFAVNYSNPLIQLLKEGSVKIDLIKCPDWEGMIREAEPYGEITVHFDLKAGFGNTFDVDFSRIKAIKDHTATPYVNTHLVAPKNLDPDNLKEVRKINQLWREEIQVMIDHFGEESVALEHFPYTLTTPHLLPAVESKNFSQVILDTNCRFLLDLSHASITADALSMDVKDYIRSLPVDRLVEMHITGIKLYGGVLTDHFALQERDWKLFAWALDQIQKGYWRKPEIVAFEYGGVGNSFVWRTDDRILRTQVPKLYEIVCS